MKRRQPPQQKLHHTHKYKMLYRMYCIATECVSDIAHQKRNSAGKAKASIALNRIMELINKRAKQLGQTPEIVVPDSEPSNPSHP